MNQNHDTIAGWQTRLARGETTREAWLTALLQRAAEPAAHATFTRLYADAALAAARAGDALAASGVALPALAGLPVSIKDLYDVAGETTLAGSRVCVGEPVAQADAPAVARLRAAGAAIVGKTNMTEFAFSGVGINPHYGTPRNPADAQVARIPGGSSSGAAVSVALGLAVAALGSDTGGSIRIPAALCGLVGFKNTQRRVPQHGALELSRSLDTVCAMTRSVRDCLTVDAVLSGTPLVVRQRPLQGVRLALPGTLLLDGLDATVARAFARSLSRLSQLGAHVIDVAMPEIGEIGGINAPGGLSPIEAYAVHRERLARNRAGFDQRVAARVALGEPVGAADYLRLLDRRQDWIARMQQALQGFDAFICPTVPMVAPETAPLLASDEAFFKTNGLLLRNPFVVNFLDGCAFSLPCHTPDELPVGLMLASVRDDDARLAAVALAVEAALASR